VASLTHDRVMVYIPQTAHTTAKITKVKDLVLIFISVFNPSGLRLLSEIFWASVWSSILLCHNHL